MNLAIKVEAQRGELTSRHLTWSDTLINTRAIAVFASLKRLYCPARNPSPFSTRGQKPPGPSGITHRSKFSDDRHFEGTKCNGSGICLKDDECRLCHVDFSAMNLFANDDQNPVAARLCAPSLLSLYMAGVKIVYLIRSRYGSAYARR